MSDFSEATTLQLCELYAEADEEDRMYILAEWESRQKAPPRFEDYQAASAKTDLTPGDKRQHILEIVGEVGELAQMVKREIRDNTEPDKAEVESEIGDILWGLSQIATDYGIDLVDAAGGNLAKLESRKKRGVIKGKGGNR